MKLFVYVFLAVLLLGGAYVLFVDRPPPAATATSTWETESQNHLATLLSDQLRAAQSRDWSTFDADLKKADAHLAQAPAGVNPAAFRTALQAYHSQQDLRTQMPQ